MNTVHGNLNTSGGSVEHDSRFFEREVRNRTQALATICLMTTASLVAQEKQAETQPDGQATVAATVAMNAIRSSSTLSNSTRRDYSRFSEECRSFMEKRDILLSELLGTTEDSLGLRLKYDDSLEPTLVGILNEINPETYEAFLVTSRDARKKYISGKLKDLEWKTSISNRGPIYKAVTYLEQSDWETNAELIRFLMEKGITPPSET